MNPLTHAAFQARLKLAAPIRAARMRAMMEVSEAPISAMFYHRVADTHPNDWTISKEKFQQQVDYCHCNFEMIDLAEVQRRVQSRDSCSAAASITFDDGYSDNCDFALPLLIERGIPCTYFVSTENVLSQVPFPHDSESGVLLKTNTVEQLREFSDAGIEIGCHTRTHIDFSRVQDPTIVRREIIDAKCELEQMIGRAVRFFAFPYGMPQQLTQMAIEAVYEAGFQGFCSAFGGYNLVGQDAFHLRRFHCDQEFNRFANWLSFDTRKVRMQPAVRYFLPPSRSFYNDSVSLTAT